ncbi:MAG TPA: hypothetical protein VN771_04395 [Candidatus Baltobacteraceae bacterium]|nr:hypothetical protein [Candidatus Baltobacteraceae bacterium]
MADWLASLPLGAWLFMLFLAGCVPFVLFTTLLLVAFVPDGAGRAGWRDRLVLPRRVGTTTWRQLHPAWSVPPFRPRHMIGGVVSLPPVHRRRGPLTMPVGEGAGRPVPKRRAPVNPAPETSA